MLTIQESTAKCNASFAAMKVAVNSSKTAITTNLVDEVTHSVAHKCPAGIAKLVSYLDEQGLYKEMKAVKKFALDFTGVSLKGENPSINDERHEAAQTLAGPELIRLQELGIIGWYEQATGTGKDEKETKVLTKEQKQAAKQAKALETLEKVAVDTDNPDHTIMKMVLEYKVALEKANGYNPSAASDQHNKVIGKLTTVMMASINQLQPAA